MYATVQAAACLSSDSVQSPRCLAHIVNLGVVAVMGHITKIAAVETTTAIWEYDPDLPDNRILGGSLDVIAAIRTLAVKVRCLFASSQTLMLLSEQIQSSGQRIEYFQKLQIETGINAPLVIPLHSNIRWGSAYNMLDRSYRLRQVCYHYSGIARPLLMPSVGQIVYCSS
jgi:hypothetical protein